MIHVDESLRATHTKRNTVLEDSDGLWVHSETFGLWVRLSVKQGMFVCFESRVCLFVMIKARKSLRRLLSRARSENFFLLYTPGSLSFFFSISAFFLMDFHSSSDFCMCVSFIGLRLTKTSLTLINRTRLRTKGQSPVTLKPKLESLPILSSVEHLSEL